MNKLLNDPDIYGIDAFFALGSLIFYPVIFFDLRFKSWYVYENIIASIVWFDKAKAFGVIEEFYGSLRHNFTVV